MPRSSMPELGEKTAEIPPHHQRKENSGLCCHDSNEKHNPDHLYGCVQVDSSVRDEPYIAVVWLVLVRNEEE